MLWFSKVITPLILITGIATTSALIMADDDGKQPPSGKGPFEGGKQPPFGKGGFGKGGKKFDKKFDKKGDRKFDKKEQFEDKNAQPNDKKGPKADPIVDAWLAVLLTKITDPHDTVRDSARAAVIAIGPPAIPTLQKLADGNDSAKAVAAQKLIHAIHQHHEHHIAGHEGPGWFDAHRGPGGFDRGRFAPPFGKGGMGGMDRRGGPPKGMGPMGHEGPGERKMGPKEGDRRRDGGDRGRDPRGRGGREVDNDLETAPMPREVASR